MSSALDEPVTLRGMTTNRLPAAWPYGRLTFDQETITFHARFWWPGLFIKARVFTRATTVLNLSRILGSTSIGPAGPERADRRVRFSRWFHGAEVWNLLGERGWTLQRVDWRGHPVTNIE